MSPVNIHNVISITGNGKGITRKYVEKNGQKVIVANNAVMPDNSLPVKEEVIIAAGGPVFAIDTMGSPFLVLSWNISLFDIISQKVDATIDASGVQLDSPRFPRRRSVRQFRMRLFSYLLCGLIGFRSNAYANLRGDQLIDQYLTRSARHDAMFSVTVDYQEPTEEPVRLEFTWMPKVKSDVTCHLLRIEAPGSEQGKLLLVHEKADGVVFKNSIS